MRDLIKVVCFFSLVNFVIAQARGNESLPEIITGIYSNMRYNEEAGDLLGVEIFLVNSDKGYFVVFQGAEGGAASVPIVVKSEIQGNKITFTLPENSIFPGVFRGHIQKSQIVGSFDKKYLNPAAPGQTFILPKKKSYWQ